MSDTELLLLIPNVNGKISVKIGSGGSDVEPTSRS